MVPTLVENSISDVFPGPDLDLFSDRKTRLQDPEPARAQDRYADIRLYDLPFDGPLTVADYRHAHFVDQPPLSLTSPHGEELNRAFDRFILAKPDTDDPSVLSGSNPWLEPSDPSTITPTDLFGPSAAALLRIDGAFNVNSTSIDAWRAVFSQSSRGRELWSRGLNRTIPNRLALNQYFSRLPSGALQLTPGLSEEEITDPSSSDGRRESLRHGYRTLDTTKDLGEDSPSVGQRQLHQLAYHIVDLIKENAQPFTSLSDFINSGVLEEAITRVGPATTNPDISAVKPINEGRMGYEPTALRQTDLVAHLAPIMSARSDTFRIHVKAETLAQFASGPSGRAALEAVVQREFSLRPGVKAASNPTLADYERGFKIVSLKWLEN